MTAGANSHEQDLIRQIKEGDRSAFASLLHLYNARVYGYFLRTFRRRELAEDLFQETFLRVWRSFHRFDEKRSFAAWVFKIAERVSIDAMRSEGIRKSRMILTDAATHVDPEDIEANLHASELQKQIEDAANLLPEKQRKVFLMRQQGELSFREIAGIMDEPLNSVLSHMHYAVKKLRGLIKVNDEV